MASEGNNLLAFAAFYDHPSLSNVPQSEWEKWLHTNYDCPQANVREFNIYTATILYSLVAIKLIVPETICITRELLTRRLKRNT